LTSTSTIDYSEEWLTPKRVWNGLLVSRSILFAKERIARETLASPSAVTISEANSAAAIKQVGCRQVLSITVRASLEILRKEIQNKELATKEKKKTRILVAGN
jgi:hypothetical protein